MSDNLDLNLSPDPVKRFGSTDPEAAAPWLIAMLEGRQTWTTAADILRDGGLAVSEDNKRWLRAVRAATNGVVVGGPGSPGYRHLRTLTSDEFRHFDNQGRSQMREMTRTMIQTRRLWHGFQLEAL
jgi:hypothetical protein